MGAADAGGSALCHRFFKRGALPVFAAGGAVSSQGLPFRFRGVRLGRQLVGSS
jgi:hypothetical protein